MATNTLASAWSPDSSPHHYANTHMAHLIPGSSTRASNHDSFKTFFLNTLVLSNRLMSRVIAHLISAIPTSKRALRDTGVIPYYKHMRNINSMTFSIAKAHGITVPSFPEISENWEDENALDYNTLYEALELHAVGPAKAMLIHIRDMLTPEKYHWSTLVAVISVGTDYHIDTMPRRADATEAKGLEGVLDDEEPLGSTKVLRETVARLRENTETTGWREQEAKELETKNRGLVKALWGLPTTRVLPSDIISEVPHSRV